MADDDISTSIKLSPDLELAPIRSLDDFLLNSARFQLPHFNDVNRWSNRVQCNLIYYQTNYFILMAILFLIITLMHPRDMILGSFSVCLAMGIYIYLTTTTNAEIVAFKKEHQLFTLGLMAFGAFICLFMFGSILTVLFAVALPLFVSFAHASLRLRNMKNKLANRAEAIGATKTVMGRILDILGLKIEAIRYE